MLRAQPLRTSPAQEKTIAEEHIRGTPAVALVDLRLPGGHDGAALERVKALFPEVQVVEKPFATARLLDLIEMLSIRERAS